MRRIARYTPACFALLRVVAGLLYASHGAQKLLGILGMHAVPLASQMGAAGIIEVTCGSLIALGLFTRPVAFVASGEMAVAYFQVHAPQAFWPIVNRGEVPALYSFLFLYFAAHGPGAHALRSEAPGPAPG